ncbi:ferritin-like domain-containing protein [Pontibacter sp. SGAir0037]|uniref:YciE/YciF ferroxidase family protein n=1 Tax=Pontibacter sp. SGAir0037 TaxID=2571030 RepID=UPI0010CD15EC|nr:ferritin-like domain-containing protein [Pontibacter sp. SGAir0037]QCR21402.1 ferritin-like domain-containing protein [Pontibacter sp. SGAir0037]
MAKLKNLEELFHHELKDLYSAEKQLIEALPKMAKKAADPKLREAFESHLEETKVQKERLEQVCEKLGISPGRMKCKAMEGLIAEGEEMIDENASPETKDAGLIACAQRIEHYEISGYGTAAQFAESLGHSDAHKLLSETLKEEKDTDSKLNKLAKASINKKAMKEE